ncbi:metallophosphoesterase family protein [Planctomicrobium sp. SH527]|uniref:metallophosphoesterase family protein n=1 Tax=Planctomicrobium sp. SH527 TaxID=3448123 RepID=UPI003F5C24EC
MFKFIHAADIHLDSPLRGLEKYEGAPVDTVRQASRRALENLVQLALDEQVAFVLISGDLYDGNWNDFSTGLFFQTQVAKLRDAGIRLFLIAGNHDAANRMTKSLNLPPDMVKMFSPKEPETVTIDSLGVAIHGQSFATQAVKDDLSRNYPRAISGLFNVGMLHTCATGREGHEAYAPCTIGGLKQKEYQYWALGHVHNREVLDTESNIVFPGNLQGRNIRESGAKGCYLVTVQDDQSCTLDFRPTDVMRWEVANVDVSSATSADDVLQLVSSALNQQLKQTPDHPLAVRVELRGELSIHQQLMAESTRWTNEIRSLGINAEQDRIWIEKVKIRTSEPTLARQLTTSLDGPLGELTSLIDDAQANPSLLQDWGCDLKWIRSKLPQQVQDEIPVDDAEWLSAMIDEAKAMLLEDLRGGSQQ